MKLRTYLSERAPIIFLALLALILLASVHVARSQEAPTPPPAASPSTAPPPAPEVITPKENHGQPGDAQLKYDAAMKANKQSQSAAIQQDVIEKYIKPILKEIDSFDADEKKEEARVKQENHWGDDISFDDKQMAWVRKPVTPAPGGNKKEVGK